MDFVIIILLGLGVLAGAAALGGDDDSDDAPEGGGIGGSSEPGLGGQSPDGEHDLIWGSANADIIDGTDHPEVIESYQDDDTISGGFGNDRIFAAGGDDRINPGGGDDLVLGDTGADLVDGGFVAGTFGDTDAFFDGLEDRANRENLFTLTDAEHLAAANLSTLDVSDDFGSDFIRGEDDNDVLADGFGADTLHGDLGDDLLFGVDVADGGGDPHADELFGGFGSDTILADSGDTVTGGEGVDHIIIANSLNTTETGEETHVNIIGFDPEYESIQIEDLNGEYGSDPFVLDEHPEGTYLSMNGIDIALFEGLTAADLADLEVIVNERTII